MPDAWTCLSVAICLRRLKQLYESSLPFDHGAAFVWRCVPWVNRSGGLVEMAASLVSAESTAAAAREAQLRPLRPVESEQTASTAEPAPAPAAAPTLVSAPTSGPVVRQTGARVAHTLVGLTSPSQRGKIGLDAADKPSKFPAPGSRGDVTTRRQEAADEIASPTPMEISVSTEADAHE